MSNYKDKKNRYDDASYFYNKCNHSSKGSPVDVNKVEIIGKRPVLNKYTSQIGRDIVFPHSGQ